MASSTVLRLLNSEKSSDDKKATQQASFEFPFVDVVTGYVLLCFEKEDAMLLASFLPCFNRAMRYYTPCITQLSEWMAKGEEIEYVRGLDYARRFPGLVVGLAPLKETLCGQREWKSVSPLTRVTWGDDAQACDELIACLNTDELRKEALRQIKNVKEKGAEHGSYPHVLMALHSFMSLKKEIDEFKDGPTVDIDDQRQKWGEQQKVIWALMLRTSPNVFFHLCNPSIRSCPELINHPSITRSAKIQWYDSPDSDGSKEVLLDLSKESKLGLTYGLAFVDDCQPHNSKDYSYYSLAQCIESLSLFSETRARQLDEQIVKLEARVGAKKSP